jgi:hypothetical protein
MNVPLSTEVDIRALVPGERYYAVSTRDSSHFNGVFTEYYTNEAGYEMLRFHYTKYVYPNGPASSDPTDRLVPHSGTSVLGMQGPASSDPTDRLVPHSGTSVLGMQGPVSLIGSPDEHPWGSYWRIFNDRQSFRYYKICRFTKKEVKELTERCLLRERRQYERALTGTISSGLYLPRDIVREISLKYVTSYTSLKTPYHCIHRHASKSQPAP